jgi:hypothetical protein
LIAGNRPRGDAKDAFKAILDGAMLGVPVLRNQEPGEGGVPVPSVVFPGLVSGVSRTGAIGRQESETQRALEERYRIQIDCYQNSKVECDALASAVAQAIVDHEDTFERVYGIENINKLDDADMPPANEMAKESRVRMDYGFTMYRALS